MAMEPMGSVAGIAAALQGAVSTFGGALLGAAIGWQFRGSTAPLALGTLLCGVLALLAVLFAERGRLFHAQHARDSAAAVLPEF
jgi:DHA1 family bicyclomycin/chloramphenicol resistance-like MFS transporter